MSEAQKADERVRTRNPLQTALSKPSAGAIIATIIALLVFTWPIWECIGDAQACTANGFLTPRGISNWLEVAAQVGILAAAVTLLMIGGEVDLSVGSMIGAAGMVLALSLSEYGLDPATERGRFARYIERFDIESEPEGPLGEAKVRDL